MMSDVSRQNSPKSSPRGSRSPAYPGYPRQDSSGTLKTTITLGKKPSVFQGGTFYLMKDPPEASELTGVTNLMSYYGLERSYQKFSSKKVKEELSAFLPHLPGNIDQPGSQDNSSLRSLVEKPPILGKELMPLPGYLMAGFRLYPGPLPEQYRLMSQAPEKRKKHKKHKKDGKDNSVLENQDNSGLDSSHDFKKNKKPKRTDEERKKRKKEKRKKKEKEKEIFAPTAAIS